MRCASWRIRCSVSFSKTTTNKTWFALLSGVVTTSYMCLPWAKGRTLLFAPGRRESVGCQALRERRPRIGRPMTRLTSMISMSWETEMKMTNLKQSLWVSRSNLQLNTLIGREWAQRWNARAILESRSAQSKSSRKLLSMTPLAFMTLRPTRWVTWNSKDYFRQESRATGRKNTWQMMSSRQCFWLRGQILTN